MRSKPLNVSSHRFIPFLFGAITLSLSAGAQSDDCATATVIAGTGTFPFDTTGFDSSTHSLLDSDCASIFQFPIYAAGFYEWTAPASDSYFISGPAGFGDVLGVYEGAGCSTDCAGGNTQFRDAGLPAGILVDDLQAGQTYLLEVGSDVPSQGGTGALTILSGAEYCAALAPDVFEPNDSCATAALLPGPGTQADLTLTPGDSDFYQVFVPAGHLMVAGFTMPGALRDLNVYDSNCQLVPSGVRPGFGGYRNETSQPQIITLEVAYTPTFAGWDCRSYSLTYQTGPDLCAGTPDDPQGDNDDCATAQELPPGSQITDIVTFADPDFYAVEVAPGATTRLTVQFTAQDGGLRVDVRSLNDPACDSLTTDSTLPLSIHYSGGLVNIEITNPGTLPESYRVSAIAATPSDVNEIVCRSYTISREPEGGVPICAGSPNSTGVPSTLTGQFGSGVGADLHLDAIDGPPGQFGYFLVGTGYQDAGITPISNGSLCLTGQIGRYNFFGFGNDPGGMSGTQSLGTFDASGVFTNAFGNATSTGGLGFDVPSRLPFPGGPTLGAGASLTFQLWYRDNPAGLGQSNLSNGYFVQFP